MDLCRPLSSLRTTETNATTKLGLLGLLTALVYLLALTIPYWLPAYYLDVKKEIYQFAAQEPWRGILFYVALAALFSLYILACRLAWHPAGQRLGAGAVLGWTLVFGLLLIPIHPLTSSDIYGYTFQGRIVAVWGQNPFVHLYREFASDPLYTIVTFHHLPASSGYGPLWIATAGGLGWLARDNLLLNLLLFKGLAAALHLSASLLVYAALRRLGAKRPVAGMLFYAWNPILLYELVGNGHNDAALAALALLGFYFLSRRQGLPAILCLTAAALVKPVAVLWLPLVAVWLLARLPGWRARLRLATGIGLLVLLATVAAYAPFWQGLDTFQGLRIQSNIHGNSLPNLLIEAGMSLWPQAGYGVVQGVKLLSVLLLASFYLWQLWIVWRSASGRPPGDTWHNLVRACFDVMLFYLLFAGLQFWPWYLSWLLVPAALFIEPSWGLRRRLALVLCLGAPLLYFPFGWQWARSSLPPWLVATLTTLPLAGLAGWLGLRAWLARQQ